MVSVHPAKRTEAGLTHGYLVASVTVTTPNGDPDAYWKRPPETPDQPTGAAPAPGGVPEYGGPPPTAPPPPGWRPPLEVQPAPPRALPPQDHTELDTAEQSARTVTYVVGGVAGVVLLVVVCALCSRVLF